MNSNTKNIVTLANGVEIDISPSRLVGLASLTTLMFIAAAIVCVTVMVVQNVFDGLVSQWAISFIGLFIGALFARVQLWAWHRYATLRIVRMLGLGIIAVLVSQILFLIIVWSDVRTNFIVIRLWWSLMIPSTLLTYLLVLRTSDRAREHPRFSNYTTCVAIVFSLLVLFLGYRTDVFAGPETWYLYLMIASLGVLLLMTAFFMIPWAKQNIYDAYRTKKITAVALVSIIVAVMFFSYYVGRARERTNYTVASKPLSLFRSAQNIFKESMGRKVYTVQSNVAEFFGDTRIYQRDPFITVKQIKEVAPRFRPGDIILERRNWYMSNPWLPGFWPHAALYIGSPEELKEYDVLDHPDVKKYLPEYQMKTEHGDSLKIIEAVSEGVILNTLEHSIHADYVVVLRPRLNKKQISEAIVRAFRNLGREYDFNFDFDDRERLVCTQTVWLSYEGMLNIPLVNVMGRRTLPAHEIAKLYAAERKSPDRQFDFVFFLDADCRNACAVLRDEEAFCETLTRPQAWVESD